MIKKFKQYFNSKGLYSSANLDSSEIDDEFIFAGKSIENKLSIGSKICFDGIIIKGNKLNAKTSPSDVEAALRLVAQVDVGDFDFKDNQENPPLATKFVPTADDMKIQTGDPSESQQIGLMQEDVPKSIKSNIDERFLIFSRINKTY